MNIQVLYILQNFPVNSNIKLMNSIWCVRQWIVWTLTEYFLSNYYHVGCLWTQSNFLIFAVFDGKFFLALTVETDCFLLVLQYKTAWLRFVTKFKYQLWIVTMILMIRNQFRYGVNINCTSLYLQLWALLHFIMPTMFDSHDEFNEWFSKDIESHAEKQSGIDESK